MTTSKIVFSKKKPIAAGLAGLIVAVGLFLALKTPAVVVVDLDSKKSPEQKRALFDRHRHWVDYPDGATEVCYHLEPENYATPEEICGEYVRFKANRQVIESFISKQFSEEDKVIDKPTPYSTWHFGIGNYSWWRPQKVEDPVYYEKGQAFATIDWENGIVYYSYLRS